MAGRGISFLDLLFAEALAAGIAREAQRAARPPPDNFFVLSGDPSAWKRIQTASKEENLVVAFEFTVSANMACRSLQERFVDLAREFDGIPFVRARIGPGSTFDEMRKDLGGVEIAPSFIIVFYDDDGIYKASYEGVAEIREALSRGRIQAVIKEFMERRMKLKLAEHLAGQLAAHVLGARLRQARSEYEDRMKKTLEERKKLREKEEHEEKVVKIKEEKQKLESEMEELQRKLEEKKKAMDGLDEDLQKVKIRD